MAEADEWILGSKVPDDYEIRSSFYSIDETKKLNIFEHEQVYLETALKIR